MPEDQPGVFSRSVTERQALVPDVNGPVSVPPDGSQVGVAPVSEQEEASTSSRRSRLSAYRRHGRQAGAGEEGPKQRGLGGHRQRPVAQRVYGLAFVDENVAVAVDHAVDLNGLVH
jgi:hypothetical protein